jgi:hypothetical protein
MSRAWRWFLPGYVLAAPHTILGLLLAIVYRCHSWQWRDGVLTCLGGTFQRDGKTITRIWGRPGAQTHGWLLVAADEDQRSRSDLRVHECVHVVQGFCGPLYMLAYGLSFLAIWAWRRGPWTDAYERIPFEVQAYDRQDRYRLMPPSMQVHVWGHR